MKKVSLAATIALTLMSATTVANANGTVKSQPAATPAAAPATTAAAAAPAMTSMGGATNPASVELIARPGNHKNTNFELDFMFPVFQPSCGDRLLAIDIRGMRDVNRNTEGNGGLVYRHIVNNSFVLGGYVFGDYRRTRNHNSFGQLTVGADILSNMVDARFNGYIAQNKKKTLSGGANTQFIGNAIARFNNYETTQSGFDGEIGVRIPMPGMNNVETRVFAGGYRFSRGGTKTMSGPRGRLEVRILDLINPGSRLTLGVDVSNDKVRKTTVNGVIGLRIPMQFISGGKVPQGLQRRLADYVYRDVNVNTAAVQQRVANMKDGKTGKDFFVVHVKGPGSATAATTQSGDGTAEKPFAMWDATAVTAASANPGTLQFLEGSGTINAPAASVTPTNNQAWYGPATDVVLTDANDGKDLQVQKASSTNVITIAGNNNSLFTVGAANPTVRKIAGFTHTTGANANAQLISGTYTGSADVTISDIKTTADPAVANSYVALQYNGNGITGNVFASNVSVSAFEAPFVLNNPIGNGAAIGVHSTGGAKVVVKTSKLAITGGPGAIGAGTIGLRTISTSVANVSSIDVTDTGSTYKTLNDGIHVQDNSGTIAVRGSASFNISNITTEGNNRNSLRVIRGDDGGNPSNTSITGKIDGGTFTSTAGQDIVVTSGGAGGVGQANTVNLSVSNTKHTNTASTAIQVGVHQHAVASTVTVNLNNVEAKATAAGSSGLVVVGNATPTNVGAVRVNATKVVTSVYTDAIALTGAQLSANNNIVQIDFSGGGNAFAATTNSFRGNNFNNNGNQALSMAAVANTFVPVQNGPNGTTTAAGLAAQLPTNVTNG